MNTQIETRREFWKRLAIAEIRSARIWRKIGRMESAKKSAKLAREFHAANDQGLHLLRGLRQRCERQPQEASGAVVLQQVPAS